MLGEQLVQALMTAIKTNKKIDIMIKHRGELIPAASYVSRAREAIERENELLNIDISIRQLGTPRSCDRQEILFGSEEVFAQKTEE